MDVATKADAVHMRGVEYKWAARDAFALRVAEFQVPRGERLLLLGPSGSGKSTLLSLLTGIIQSKAGTIEILGTQLGGLSSGRRDRYRAEHFGIIFQMFNLLPYGAVIDNVLLPLSFAPARHARAVEAGGTETEARRLLAALGLPTDIGRQPAANLSVGQQQRVAAARALIGAPEIVVADEPTSALDDDREEDFLNLLFSQIEATRATLIMVSHDRRLAQHFDRVLHLTDILATSRRGGEA
ncbi:MULTISPECIES: ABC transporter ATP-binding protein [unclassified Rhizobium]|uniref:ABC transporter ATP-binding protein n=1 Tax=unclassified Rhizobium TaxID=2613769 RepID=UPI001046808B|nr:MULTISPECIES: ABC transporter ATP-binding protein [unclassified Rhizobium]MBB3398687.1 putative ABC transport system ATP-binding protein [Rhizobium sp. BK060]MBB4170560.1 putative ABC transport system ATP-binding protein [Rhizobium sp. BK538]TCM69288.1 putative ABC transport system ATP-binding protein [Rhizobium sp. BK068]